MTSPILPPPPEPAPDPSSTHPAGVMARVRAWFESDIEPDIRALKTDIARFRALAPELKALADAVVMLAKAADPGAAPEIAGAVTLAEEAAEAVGRIAAELAPAGM